MFSFMKTGFTITFISVSQHFACHFIVAVVVSCGKLKTTEYLTQVDIADMLPFQDMSQPICDDASS